MAAPCITAGLTILVDTFNHNRQLPVKIDSSISIDHGASARIYKGVVQLPHHSYEVALKVIPHVLGEAKEEMIRRELKTVKQLADRSSRRILPFIGTSTLGFHTIIVAEYMKNGNMLQFFKKKPDADRQALVIQVAEAVHWLHECKGLVHGDLKCENVLVDDEGNALLADFGLSTLVEQEDPEAPTDTTIRKMNTLRFAAPELLCDSDRQTGAGPRPRSKTPQSDVYAFGMLSLQAFTGKRPWPHLSDVAVLLQVSLRTMHPRPSQDATLRGLTDAYWETCMSCWEFTAVLRPTMYQVWNRLEANKGTNSVPLPPQDFEPYNAIVTEEWWQQFDMPGWPFPVALSSTE